MLEITVPGRELFNEETEEFIMSKPQRLRLEHSLVSISKWEAKWCKPFLSSDNKSLKESIDYIKCMTLTQNVPDSVYLCLTDKNIEDVSEYIEAPMTATTFWNTANNGPKEIITSELIYYWMIALNIPFECQKWHLNRLLTLINVCNIKNSPDNKMSTREIYERNRALNEARKKKYNTKG